MLLLFALSSNPLFLYFFDFLCLLFLVECVSLYSETKVSKKFKYVIYKFEASRPLESIEAFQSAAKWGGKLRQNVMYSFLLATFCICECNCGAKGKGLPVRIQLKLANKAL